MRQRSRHSLLPLAALGAAVLALLWVAVAPIAAWAADYRCTEVDLVAQVQTDGSVSVVDQRIFEFDGAERETLKWLYEGFPEDAALVVERVRMAPANAEGAVDGEWVDLSEATFQLPWRSGGGPESDAWAYDRFQHRLYAFVGHLPSRVVFEVAYRVEGAVVAYDDAADFQWLYVPRDYAVALDNVTAEVVLPLAADDTVRAEDNVYAWGHGPADGSVSIALDGSITFTDPEVEPTQFAEARVLFPVDWLTNLSDEARLANQGNPQYSWTPRYEAEWVDRDTYRTIIRLRLIIGLLGLAAVVLVGALLVYRRWGRERPPAFTDDYGDEVPDARLAPAVMGRLWRWNHESPDDVVATVLDMVRRGALTVRRDDDGRPAALVLLPDLGARTTARAEAVLDGATLRLLRTLAAGAEELSVGAAAAFARSHPSEFLQAEQAWQLSLTALVEPYCFFDRGSRRAQRVVLLAAALVALLALVSFFALGWLPALLALAAAGATAVLGNYTMRRSVEGNNIVARAKALRNWLRDGDVRAEIDRPELVIYAYLFGVSEYGEEVGSTVSGQPVAAGILVPATMAATLAYLAPRLSRTLGDALRAAHHRAEVS
ncbi:DUF2207 family protein [Adlercreutzia muris]|uniref:DUF2207 family protein n=1 Tax=Adlercreutzia muris TaxID=1796610 RepID=UPI003511A1E3